MMRYRCALCNWEDEWPAWMTKAPRCPRCDGTLTRVLERQTIERASTLEAPPPRPEPAEAPLLGSKP